MGYFQDQGFQERMIALLCRDQKFCRKTYGLLDVKDFTTQKGQGTGAWVRQEVGKLALKYYDRFRQPIGGMLRYEVLDMFRKNSSWGPETKTKLLQFVERIGTDEDLWVSVDAVEQKIIEYKRRKQFRAGIEEMIRKQELGELGEEEWLRISKKALDGIASNVRAREYGTMDSLKQRIQERAKTLETQTPYFQIGPVDEVVDMAPRGQLNIVLAKYGVGKSNFIAHLAKAVAMQGYSVLLFTLEDPMAAFEARLDAQLSRYMLSDLPYKPINITIRMEKQLKRLRGRIKIVEATGGGWTVERLEQYWDMERNRGFIADMVLIDYDKKIQPVQKYNGDNAERFSSTEIYMGLGNWCQRANIFMWIAAQARRGQKNVKQVIVTGDDAAEDINKLREAGFCLGLGYGPKECGLPEAQLGNVRFLYVAKNRFGRGEIGWPIMTDYSRSMFYLEEETKALVENYENYVGRSKPVGRRVREA